MTNDGRATLQDLFTVMRDRTLSVDAKVLWALIRSHETPEKGAFPGDERLAGMMDKSTRTVERYRAVLLERGYLKQELRGPKPALYRAVLPEEGADIGGDSSAERDDMSDGVFPPETDDTPGEASKGSAKASPSDSSKGSPPVSPEYGEYGEYGEGGSEGSSSRGSSDPSGEAGVENPLERPDDGNPPFANLTSDELLEHGLEVIGARFGRLLRDHLYVPDGQPPYGYAEGRDIKILCDLLQQGHRPRCLELAIVGLAYERDLGKLEAAGPGEKVTARLLRSDIAGARNPVSHFENIARRLQAGELDKEELGRRRSGDGPTRVGAANDQLTPIS